MATPPLEPEIAEQLSGRVEPREIMTEMQQSYLDYAMSVIVSRALPDVRDGLKPIHRRILFAMHTMGLRPTGRYVKSAKVTGDVTANYHPHGTVAVYESMVRLAQPFSLRQILVDGQGNFGSIDGDPPAAERYTEVRMTPLAEELLADIDKETVPLADNYDGSTKEPTVLPTRVPNLLLNGTIGIAVGMATNIPTHNLGELCDGVVALIDKPETSIAELLELIPGPDFPTAAEVYTGVGLREAYATGKGKITMRAVAGIEEKKGGFRIIITELPYQVNKADLVSKIADLVKEKKVEGITDIRDESNREGVRVVIELRNNSFPKKILNQLYEATPLQSAFHINMLALVDSIEPRVLSLKEILEQFVSHRQVVVRRRSEFDLARAQDRAHILEGLLKALDAIDEVVKTIRAAKQRDEARVNLMAKFALSELQANAILDMRLATLVGLERQRLQDEYDEKQRLIAYLQDLLAHEEKILAVIREETLAIKEKYAQPRRTKLIAADLENFRPEDLIPDEEVIISLTKTNYIKRVARDTYKSQIRGGKGVVGMSTKDEDEVDFLITARTHDHIFFFTDRGRLYTCPVHEIPATSRQAKGQAIVNLIQIGSDEKVTALLTLPKGADQSEGFFIMGTTDGTVKKTPIQAYANVRKNGIIAMTLENGNFLRWVSVSSGQNVVLLVSAKAQAVLFDEGDIRPTGRSAQGVRGMKLRPEDRVVAMDVLSREDIAARQMLVVFENGFGKQTPLSHYEIQKRGGVGIKAAAVTAKVGSIVYAAVIRPDDAELMLISRQGTVIKTPLSTVKSLGRVTQGVTLMRLPSGDRVASATLLSAVELEVVGEEVPPA